MDIEADEDGELICEMKIPRKYLIKSEKIGTLFNISCLFNKKSYRLIYYQDSRLKYFQIKILRVINLIPLNYNL